VHGVVAPLDQAGHGIGVLQRLPAAAALGALAGIWEDLLARLDRTTLDDGPALPMAPQ